MFREAFRPIRDQLVKDLLVRRWPRVDMEIAHLGCLNGDPCALYQRNLAAERWGVTQRGRPKACAEGVVLNVEITTRTNEGRYWLVEDRFAEERFHTASFDVTLDDLLQRDQTIYAAVPAKVQRGPAKIPGEYSNHPNPHHNANVDPANANPTKPSSLT